jgi:hypothetical protein
VLTASRRIKTEVKVMKKVIAGVMLGVVTGLAVGAGAVGAGPFGYYRVNEMGPQSQVFKLGYAAGAFDMLGQIVDDGVTGQETWTQRDADYKQIFQCFQQHGATLGSFTDWASQAWVTASAQYGRDSAASSLMAACFEPVQ